MLLTRRKMRREEMVVDEQLVKSKEQKKEIDELGHQIMNLKQKLEEYRYVHEENKKKFKNGKAAQHWSLRQRRKLYSVKLWRSIYLEFSHPELLKILLKRFLLPSQFLYFVILFKGTTR